MSALIAAGKCACYFLGLGIAWGAFVLGRDRVGHWFGTLHEVVERLVLRAAMARLS